MRFVAEDSDSSSACPDAVTSTICSRKEAHEFAACDALISSASSLTFLLALCCFPKSEKAWQLLSRP
jgi:hypothetical protein